MIKRFIKWIKSWFKDEPTEDELRDFRRIKRDISPPKW